MTHFLPAVPRGPTQGPVPAKGLAQRLARCVARRVALPLALGLSLALSLSGMPRAAEAQQNRCAPRPQMLLLLEERRSETRRAIGLTSAATVMELYASEAGSWTLVVTMPSGLTCQVASGSDFESLEAALAGAPV